jgi:hypothetical protein
MINYNLAGKALVHCLKLSGSKLLVVDDDPELFARIEDERAHIEGQLDMNIVTLDAGAKRKIRELEPDRPSDLLREGVVGDGPMSIFYTRHVS